MGRYLTLLGTLVALGGCAGLVDPFQRQGTWAPDAVNYSNLRAMLVNPVDLQQGKGATDSNGATAALAVQRYRADKVKELPQSYVSTIAPAAGSATNAGGSGGTE